MIFNKKHQASVLKKRNLVTFSNPYSIISDQFRTIRTNIQFLSEERKKRTFLITSTGKSEGKSTIIANLAVSMSQQKEKVLLIDANLREPIIHKIFKIPNEVGLTNVLTNRIIFEDAIQRPGIGKMKILSSGSITANPAELLGYEQMTDLLRMASNSYDIVLIDSPSVLEFTETRVLANQCDGVVLVLNRGKTELEKAAEARRVLELAHAKLIGAIINEK
ncbi:polysaccharide biosynthesis tyrosine autokinase [Peribacillus cavernae]|uniref:non-specific protein-tyrosine kinase n=1 Tax=Peribacillus cavernae TaxID=1674310 RepID=A0A3S0UF22_9BACI|nr:CpsD/CapB family tyrosine-protein kinase [Peribacillus cavernae]MDQ0217499.1 capsular exopolysaccharide synthesis family protein [Peribacillus cavernae]RUQ30061.1 polysaccharide biosynthesis tyrosine autokinase [Peribacillus cavernae]